MLPLNPPPTMLVGKPWNLNPPTAAVGSLHISHDDEMCARGPILLAGAVAGPDAETLGPFAPSFIVDRAAVWEKLAEILLTNDAFTVIKAAKKTRNGRLAYQLLYAHCLGPNIAGLVSSRQITPLLPKPA